MTRKIVRQQRYFAADGVRVTDAARGRRDENPGRFVHSQTEKPCWRHGLSRLRLQSADKQQGEGDQLHSGYGTVAKFGGGRLLVGSGFPLCMFKTASRDVVVHPHLN